MDAENPVATAFMGNRSKNMPTENAVKTMMYRKLRSG
jgi:hypothetical protein